MESDVMVVELGSTPHFFELIGLQTEHFHLFDLQ